MLRIDTFLKKISFLTETTSVTFQIMYNRGIFSLAVGLVFVVNFSAAQVVSHEGGTVIASCFVADTTYKTSAVYWYSFGFSEYVTKDYDVTLSRNHTANLINRLSVIGKNGHYDLKIENVTVGDAGDYACGYYVSQSDYVTVKNENIVVHEPIPPEPGYPLCATEPADQLQPNMSVKLACISRGGSPPATLRWYRDDIPLQTSNTEFEGYHERTLTPEDNGVKFVCKSTSPRYDTPKECSITPLRLMPQVRIYENHNPVNIGDDVRFQCVGAGIPSIISYSWYKNGELITQEFKDRLIISGDNNDILTLKAVDRRENGSIFRCDVETLNGLKNTEEIRLTILPEIILPDTTAAIKMPSYAPVIEPQDDNDTGMSFGAVFGCILAGILIALIVLGVVKMKNRYQKQRQGEVDFTRVSLKRLNNYRHQNIDEFGRFNQTNLDNKPCNLGATDLAAVKTCADYDLIKETRKESIENNDKQIEEHKLVKQTDEHYANPDIENNCQTDCQTYHNVDSVTDSKEHSAAATVTDQINPLYAAMPDSSAPNPLKNPRIRSYSVENQRNLDSPVHYQSPRLMMPKIYENSRRGPIKRRCLARSLPDLTPKTGMVSIPIDFEHHDYVNMATSPISIPDGSEYHDYVNYTHDVSSIRNRVVRSDSSSSGYCEDLESPSVLLPAVSPTKKLRYAELDFPEYSDVNDNADVNSLSSTENITRKSTENILQYCPIPTGSQQTGPLSPPLISYAKIAYVFKDRRQQSEPSVQRAGVTR